jgi:hypothetical protein
MDVKLKKLSEQVFVITGASSGIGLVTAREAARRGAKLVVAARAEDALRQLVEEINSKGGEAVYVAADVGNQEDVRRIAETALERFGRIDTWVNNAGVSIYGKIVDTPVEDMRQLFETDFWGVVHGSLAAVQYLRQRGGALINVGSTVSDRAIPLQGVYSSSKHAKNLLDKEPALPPPVYAPEAVAEAILHCAETPVRDVFVGFGGKAMGMLDKYAPRLGDKVMETFMFDAQKKDEPARGERERGLYEASGELKERSGDRIYVSESSLYTKASLHPILTGALFVGAGLATAALVSQRKSKADRGTRAQSKGEGASPSAAGLPAEG